VVGFGVEKQEYLTGGMEEVVEVMAGGRGEGPQFVGDGAREGVPFGRGWGLGLAWCLWVGRTSRGTTGGGRHDARR